MDALLRRRQMIGGCSAPLPYTPVEYIETDGTAYIDTGIKGNVTKSMEIKLIPVLPQSGNSYIMGCRKDSGNTRFVPLLLNANGCAGFSYGANIYNDSSSAIDCSTSATNQTPIRVRCSLYPTSQVFGVQPDGGTWTTKTKSVQSSITTNRNLIVFGMDNYGTILHSVSGTKIYHVKIWSEADYTNILFDGFACYCNGEYGLWDNVTNSFFGNVAGSGAFTGPSI